MQGNIHVDESPLQEPGRISVVLPQRVRSSSQLEVSNLWVVNPEGMLTLLPLAFLKLSAVGSPSVMRRIYDFAQGTYRSVELVPVK